jgi:hypothetical protein
VQLDFFKEWKNCPLKEVDMATLYVRVFVSLICISFSAAAKSGYFLTVIALAAGRLEDS